MKVEEVNPANHTARVTARGADAKDSGGANATASFRLEPEGSVRCNEFRRCQAYAH
jgi:hypothetical protein